MPILTWLLHVQGTQGAIQAEWADLRRLPRPPKTLSERIHYSLELFPCDLLFVHRDAETDAPETREAEIRSALDAVTRQRSVSAMPPSICVVPVRMQEAWLLVSEMAIRQAVGNPRGTTPLNVVSLHAIEALPDPKQSLHHLLREASGLTGRRLKQFRVHRYASRVADFIDDFSPLRALQAFRRLEADVHKIIMVHGWNQR